MLVEIAVLAVISLLLLSVLLPTLVEIAAGTAESLFHHVQTMHVWKFAALIIALMIGGLWLLKATS